MRAFEACVPDAGAIVASGRHESSTWRVPALILGVVLAGLATLAVAALPPLTAPSARPSRHGLLSHSATRLPITLAPTASASIGASDRIFWPVPHGASLLTQGGGIHSTFTASGVNLSVAQGTLGLALTAVGRSRRLGSLAAVAPTDAANEVLYRQGPVTEVYRNGPYGLEQGFTVRQRPQTGTGSLVLALGVEGSLVPEQAGSGVLFKTQTGAVALRYSQLSAIDATGRRLPAHMQVRDGTLQLRMDDSRARYPLRIDPFIQQGEKLTGGGQTGKGELGESVAISSDGNTALIGGPSDRDGVGAAWVFTRAGSTWTQQGGKLSGEHVCDGGGGFGASVALSADGDTALIGGPDGCGDAGAAWVYTRSGSTSWTQQGKLTGGGEDFAFFGASVALSADGNTALIGGPGHRNVGGPGYDSGGAAWVYTRSGSTWTQQGGKLTGGGETGGGEFGAAVALAADGDTALIGEPGDNSGYYFGGVGAAWVFTRAGSTWTQQGGKLTGGGGIGLVRFGESVALSSDGATALIGGPGDNGHVGAAWVYARSGSTWTQQGEKLKGGGEIGAGELGESVALSADGNTALVGAPGEGYGGAAWVFTRSGSTWTQQGGMLMGSGEVGEGRFGASVALSADGNTALIGGSGGNREGYTGHVENHSAVGAAWVFTRSHSTWTQQGGKLTGGGEVGEGRFGASVALSADGDTALIGGPQDNRYYPYGGVGAAWVFTRSHSTWTEQGGKLTGGGEVGEGRFGASVALSADGDTALIGGPQDNRYYPGHVGAAWVFTRSGSTWTQQGGKLIPGAETGCYRCEEQEFGTSVALSADGDTALIGGPQDNRDYPGGVGAAWVFTRSSATWTQQGGKLIRGAGEGREFGTSVALSSDGNTALLGGVSSYLGEGAALEFTRAGSTWTQQGEAFTGTGEEPRPVCCHGSGVRFGESVALSADGDTALIGGPNDKSDAGAAWVFVIPERPTVKKLSPKQGDVTGGSTVTVTGTNFTGATALRFGSTNATSFTLNSATSITAVSPAEAAGTVDVTVTTPGGTSAISPHDRFRFR
jgi:IPT/TIG domain